MTSSIEPILMCGDPLERLFFRDVEFATAFHIYPKVWSKAVLPFRSEGSAHLAVPERASFASSHYSAIVRCWSMYQTRLRLSDISAKSIGAVDEGVILALHDALFSYFCLAGAAIDNLQKCFRGPTPSRGDRTFEGSLEWFYDRRTRLVHQIVVPVWTSNGLPQLSPDSLGKGVSWSAEISNGSAVTPCSVAERVWPKFVQGMSGWWSKLLAEQPDAQPPTTPSHVAALHDFSPVIEPSGSPSGGGHELGGID